MVASATTPPAPTATAEQVLGLLASYAGSVAIRHGHAGGDLIAGAMTLAIGILTDCYGWQYPQALKVCIARIEQAVAAASKGGAS